MKEESSFRDPDGFIFIYKDSLYRAVTPLYKENYDYFINSGLYNKLLSENWLIPHKEVELDRLPAQDIYKILLPEFINYISYPYEWCFSQLKDAALLTLKIQKTALDFGMSLKDASAFNIQFYKGKPVFIDTLSFEKYKENQPWNAYKQFCQHFLAPLSLMCYRDIRLNNLLKNYIDGIPLDLAHKLLPRKTKFKLGILLHIHLHASAQKKYHSNKVKVAELKKKFSKDSFTVLISSLKKTINRLQWKSEGTEWGDYYDHGVHLKDYTENKKELVRNYVEQSDPKTIWDLGSNTGVFSRIAAGTTKSIISFDIDPACVENNYQQIKTNNEKNLLPVLFDLTNPSPSLGWANSERKSFTNRANADLIMALALIHHLAISNNLPFDKIAEYFSHLSKWLLIEFVPKEDNKVQTMLKNRIDIFDRYTIDEFENVFSKYYKIEQKNKIENSNRTLYLMKRLS